MNFPDAIKTCFQKYVTFSGRSTRSEYWYWILFSFIVNVVSTFSLEMSGGSQFVYVTFLIIQLGLLLPGFTVAFRRLHDVDKSGWWMLILFLPIIGLLIYLYFMIKKGTEGENRFGADPLAGHASPPEDQAPPQTSNG